MMAHSTILFSVCLYVLFWITFFYQQLVWMQECIVHFFYYPWKKSRSNLLMSINMEGGEAALFCDACCVLSASFSVCYAKLAPRMRFLYRVAGHFLKSVLHFTKIASRVAFQHSEKGCSSIPLGRCSWDIPPRCREDLETLCLMASLGAPQNLPGRAGGSV